MKILYYGTTDGRSTAQFYLQNFLRQGHTVLAYSSDWGPLSFADRVSLKIFKEPAGAKRRRTNEGLLDLCRKNYFDLIFVMADNFLSPETLEEIRNLKNRPLLVFHSHDNVFHTGIAKPRDFAEAMPKFDYVFTTKSGLVEKYRAIGQTNAHYIPSAFEPSVHHPVPVKESRIPELFDVSFIGTYATSRDKYVEAAGWENLNVWGDAWKRYPHYAAHASRIRGNSVYYFEMADIFSRSNIVLGLLREEVGDLHTQRSFEIPACGAFQIANRTEEMRGFFEEDREAVYFATPEELREKVEFYRRNTKARVEIAKRGYERCLKSGYTYGDRTAKILQLCGF